tara:strand:+ start:1 stop:882 length:882 start_codon:yes stop_codon:yes gene_type:complete
MGKDFYDSFQEVKDIFGLISELTKINLSDIIFNNPSNLLNETKYTQISIFTISLSLYKILKLQNNKDFRIDYMLGHSLGEYSALCAANFISIEDCAYLLKNRGELMQKAYEPNKSGMAAIIGIDCLKAENIINDNKLNVQIANDNSPIQIVISGKKEDLLYSENFFKKSGALKFILLNVSAAFHSNLMIKAEEKMLNFIKKITFNSSNIKIISNYSAESSNDISILSQNLSKQMSNKVRWVESIKTLENLKEKTIIEIGPGKILTGLIKRINKKFNLINFNSINDIENIKNAI